MARFVEPPETPQSEEGVASFTAKKTAAPDAADTPDRSLKSALEQVGKFVPAEVLAAYITLFSAANALDKTSSAALRLWLFGVASVVGLIGTWFYVAKMINNRKYLRANQVMASVAFLVWAYAYPIGIANELGAYNSVIALFALVIFTLVSGLIKLRPARA